jgi:hypothetical protein
MKKPKRNSIDAYRREILDEYRFHQLVPIRIAREPISMELALQLGLLVDTSATAEPAE